LWPNQEGSDQVIRSVQRKAIAGSVLAPAMIAGVTLATEAPAFAESVVCASGTNGGLDVLQTGGTQRDATDRNRQTWEFSHAGSVCTFTFPGDMFIRVNHCNLGSPTDGWTFTTNDAHTIGLKPESNNCFVLQWKATEAASANDGFAGRLIF
jgi:hypothetical protein